MFNAVIVLLRELGILPELTVARATAKFQQVVQDLRAVAERQYDRAIVLREEADKLEARATEADAERVRADRIATKLEELLAGD